MEETRYIISDASKKVNVEQHTLRYWEDELKLDIPRNEMGHRYYREQDIRLLQNIRVLKEQGFQLKAIKMILPNMDKLEGLDPASIVKLRDELNENTKEDEATNHFRGTSMVTQKDVEVTSNVNSSEKMGQFRTIMTELMIGALKQNNEELSDVIGMNVTNGVIKEMDYLLRIKEEREEERFRKFDQLLRDYQNSRSHSAVSKEKKERRKKRFFRGSRLFA